MRIKSLQISNILSVEDISLTFDDTGLMLLDGWNHDDDTANGAGKTSIWNALSFGLYGKLPRKITASEIVRRGCKRGSVKIEVTVGDKTISIERHRPKKEIFTVDGSEIPTQEALEKELGMTYKQFLLCMYVAQTGAIKFIDIGDSEKKDFFLDLIGFNFDDIKSSVDTDLKDLLGSLDLTARAIEKCDVKVSTYEEHLEDEEYLVAQIAQLDTSDLQRQLTNLDLTKPDVSKYADLKSKLQDVLSDIQVNMRRVADFRDNIGEIDSAIDRLEEELERNTITCPHCDESFNASKDDSVPARIEKLKHKRKMCVDKVNSSDDSKTKELEIRELLRRTKTKESDALAEYYSNKERAAELKGLISSRNAKICSFKDKLAQNEQIRKNIKDYQQRKKLLEANVETISKDIELHKTLSSIFAPTGAPAYILDSAIDLFNQKISDYISMIWPNASYELLSYKENKGGSIKAKLSDKLIIAGRDVSLGSLSGGELRCLSLSIDFAVMETIETLAGVNINPYILDEPFEALDASNRERAISMLERVAQNRQVWVIDHQSEAKAMFSDIVKVEKRNGITKLVE